VGGYSLTAGQCSPNLALAALCRPDFLPQSSHRVSAVPLPAPPPFSVSEEELLSAFQFFDTKGEGKITVADLKVPAPPCPLPRQPLSARPACTCACVCHAALLLVGLDTGRERVRRGGLPSPNGHFARRGVRSRVCTHARACVSGARASVYFYVCGHVCVCV
jgi:hypothetical protein